MKKLLAFLCLLQTFGAMADQTAVFSLTAEEMVFASKLSDENRRKFCYKFSAKERLSCLAQSQNKELSCTFDQIVEHMLDANPLEEPLFR